MQNRKQILPRHKGSSFELKSGTGGIIGMYGLKSFMEVYKIDHTFRIQTPEILDPEETVPDIPWVVSEIPDVGSANPIVARVFIQSADAIAQKTLKGKIDNKQILELMHACKEDLLICEDIYIRLKPEYLDILGRIERKELAQAGKALNPFPQISDLNASATAFLTSAKRATQRITAVFNEFYGTQITNPRFDKMLAHIRTHHPDYQEYIQFLEDNLKNVANILELRNFQEHPGPNKKTTINNSHLTPKGIRPPSWHVTGNLESPMIDDMRVILEFMICFAETNFFYCLLDNLGGWIPWHLIELAEDKRNADCPVRYKLEIDISQLPIKQN